MFNDDIFITEYLKIINEEDKKDNEDPNDDVKKTNRIVVTISRQNDPSQIPILGKALKNANVFRNLDKYAEKINAKTKGERTEKKAADLIKGFMNEIKDSLEAVEFDDDLKKKLEEEAKMSEADKKKQEDKENKEKTEVSAQQDGEGETTKAEAAKKNPETM